MLNIYYYSPHSSKHKMYFKTKLNKSSAFHRAHFIFSFSKVSRALPRIILSSLDLHEWDSAPHAKPSVVIVFVELDNELPTHRRR